VGAVANSVEIAGAASERVDGSRSGREVNGLVGWLLGYRNSPLAQTHKMVGMIAAL
jgi:hypothetical protein